MNGKYEQYGLYRPEFEHDNCGVGMVANLSGEATHDIVEKGITILKRLLHRGATGNDPDTGDGAGLLMQIPKGFFQKILKSDLFGIAMIFGGEGEEKIIEDIVTSESCAVIAWRDVPINPAAIGRDARAVMPRIRQLFISAPLCVKDQSDFERRLYIIRRQIEKETTPALPLRARSRTS